MSDLQQLSPLLLPCLRGQVEDWVYYVTLMDYREISLRFKPAEEIHNNATLNELLQRALTDRSGEISEYITKQKQHFFNAIIAGIYEGEPRWVEVTLKPNDTISDRSAVKALSESIGVLELSGEEKIFAIDGQHRVEGIKRALAERPKHGDEEGAVIFVAHNGNKRGLERTRRLFSTLNRYAKPVSLGEIIALDEDDAIAIITRRLLYHHPLLMQEQVIAASKTKSLPISNIEALTNIQTLYNFVERTLLHGQGLPAKKIRDFKRFRRPPSELDALYGVIDGVINSMIAEFEEVNRYATLASPGRAREFRGGDGGGFLLFRPIGFSILGEVLSTCLRRGIDLSKVWPKLKKANRRLDSPPWRGLLFDFANNKMRPRISKSDIGVASRLWLYIAGMLPQSELDALVSDFAGAMGVSKSEARGAINRLLIQ
jgi:DNA sulfur modification protein DndB